MSNTLPLYTSTVSAGFPSPADDHMELSLDINRHLVKNPPATFLMRVSGDSMNGAGLIENDILVVDRSVTPTNGKIVIAAVAGELTVKRFTLRDEAMWLVPENHNYPAIPFTEETEIWGVVTGLIREL
ncbi:MAG: umuD [Rickettsiales bacterium]|jgi:DNA polymerase V|nr:umuD [Rickettsiales bacterium]